MSTNFQAITNSVTPAGTFLRGRVMTTRRTASRLRLGAFGFYIWGMTLQAQVTFNPHPILPHWHDTDLTAITGGPPVGGKIAIAFDPAWGYTRTHYVAGALGDSHVHELAFYGGRWHDADLTLIAGGPNAETPNASEPTSGPPDPFPCDVERRPRGDLVPQ